MLALHAGATDMSLYVKTSVEDACMQEACMGGRRRAWEVSGEYGVWEASHRGLLYATARMEQACMRGRGSKSLLSWALRPCVLHVSTCKH